jgi:hypothetical protein
MPKVTMSLTDRDAINAERVRQLLDAQNSAHAVSIALSLTAYVVEQMRKGNELLLRSPDNTLERLVMHELGPVDSRKPA